MAAIGISPLMLVLMSRIANSNIGSRRQQIRKKEIILNPSTEQDLVYYILLHIHIIYCILVVLV